MLRMAAVIAMSLVVWTVSASKVPVHLRLTLAGIVPGAVVTQPFGCTTLDLEPFDPSCATRHTHTGVDLAAPAGTAVRAAADGGIHVGFDPGGAGLYIAEVVAQHQRVLYCHLSAVLVTEGEQVTTGQVIGEVGSTGLSTGAHLHFEVQIDGRSIDPQTWLSSS